MTREEAIEVLKDIYNYTRFDTYTTNEARTMAIKALEQEPCEDVISRQAVLDGIDTYINKAQSTGTQDDFYSFAELVVKELPSVTPKPFMNKPCEDATVKKLCATCKYEHKRPEENPCRNCERLNKWESDNTVEDAISREEAIDACNQSVNILEATDRIKDLPPVTPQEPFMNKPCVAYQVCHEDKVKILDKIRAEIEGLTYYWCEVNPKTVIDDALQIIDKYKAESEDKE